MTYRNRFIRFIILGLLFVNSSLFAQEIAQGKPVTASSVQSPVSPDNFEAENAVDGNSGTRWGSNHNENPSWITIDLQDIYVIDRVELTWEAAYATHYQIRISPDASTWTSIHTETSSNGGTDNITINSSPSGRYIQMYATAKATQYGYSLYEFEVFGALARHTVSFSTIGTGTTSPATDTSVQFGETIPTVATAATSHKFIRWETVSGTITYDDSLSASAILTPGSDASVRAVFTPLLDLSITCTNGLCTPGAQTDLTLLDTIAISASPSTGFLFSHWRTVSGTAYFTDSLTASTEVSIEGSDTEIEAVFVPLLDLTMVCTNGTCISSDTTDIIPNTSITISATPLAGFRFSRWATVTGTPLYGDSLSASTTITFSNTNTTVEAVFEPLLNLTMTCTNGTCTPGDTNGLITIDIIPITATPNSGFGFSHWETISGTAHFGDSSLSSTTLSIGTTAEIQAVFIPTYSLTTISTNGTCTPSTASGVTTLDTFSITATPATGFLFSHWRTNSGDVFIQDSTQNSTQISLKATSELEAVFYPYLDLTISCANGACTPNTTTSLTQFDTIAITASPSSVQYQFSHWSATGGTAYFEDALSATTNLSISGAHTTVTAHFSRAQVEIVALSDGNGTVTPSTPDSVNNYENYSITATANTGWAFSHWSLDSGIATILSTNQPSTFIYPHSSSVVMAHFSPLANLTLTSTVGGHTSDSLIANIIPQTNTPITAVPDSGYIFSHWTTIDGSGVFNNSSSASTYFRPDSNTTIRAHFEQTYTLEVVSDTTGYIYYPSSPIVTNLTSSHTTSVRAYSINSTSHQFSHWAFDSGSGHCNDSTYYNTYCSIDSNAVLRAHFTYRTVEITINAGSNGTATPDTVTSIKALLDTLQINAVPDSGYVFKNWYLNNGSATIFDIFSSSTQLVSNSNASITPYFSLAHKLTIHVDSNGTVSPTLVPNLIRYGDTIVTATPDSLYQFSHWTIDSGSVSLSDPQSAITQVQNISSDAYITAHFKPTHLLTVTNDSHGISQDIYHTPFDSIRIMEDDTVQIFAAPYPLWVFDSWNITSGTPWISDNTTNTPYVSLTNDAEIALSFRKKNTYQITQTPTPYQFTVHGDSTIYGALDGVYFWLIGDTTESTTLVIIEENTSASWNKKLTYYGTDSTYSTIQREVEEYSGGLEAPFNAIQHGVKYYYKVSTIDSSALNNSFDIHYGTFGKATVDKKYNLYEKTKIHYVNVGDTFSTDLTPINAMIFDYWQIDSGSVSYVTGFDSTNSITKFVVHSLDVKIRAVFHIDPLADPILNISGIDITNYHEICMDFSVYDSTLQTTYNNLDTSDFEIWEDGLSVPFTIKEMSRNSHFRIALVVDESGSMSSRYTIARNAALDFINTKRANDSIAIIGFNTSAFLRHALSDDVVSLRTAANQIRYSGSTSVNAGVQRGINELAGHAPVKAIIVFADGQNGDNGITTQTIQNANNENITIFSIGLVLTETNPLLPLAEGTGGFYSHSFDGSDLSDIFSKIRAQLYSQYQACYQTNDAVFGDVDNQHEVILRTNIDTKSAVDTAYWDEHNAPPKITLTQETITLMSQNNPSNVALPISATIVDDSSAAHSAGLLYRTLGDTAYNYIAMTEGINGYWSATIPTSAVLTPGVEFYISALDAHNLVGKSPSQNAETQPHVIPVNNPPSTIDPSFTNCYPKGNAYPYSIKATDITGIRNLFFNYKVQGSTQFKQDTLYPQPASIEFYGSIPASEITGHFFEYYIEAEDSHGAITRFPVGSIDTVYQCQDLAAPYALLPSGSVSDSTFHNSTWVSLNTLTDTLFNNIRIHYSTDPAIAPDTTFPYVMSGESIFITETTTIRMLAHHKSDTNLISLEGSDLFYKLRNLYAPFLEKLDNLNYGPELFLDSLHMAIRVPDSLHTTTSIYYSINGAPFDSTLFWNANQTVMTITDTTTFAFYAEGPPYLPSDTVYATYYPLFRSLVPELSIDSVPLDSNMFFKGSTCFTLDNGVPGTTILYSYSDTIPPADTLAKGDSLCVSQRTSVYALANSPGFEVSNTRHWLLSPYLTAAPPTITPAGHVFDSAYVSLGMSHPDTTARLFYVTDSTSVLDTTAMEYFAGDIVRITESTYFKAFAYISSDTILPSLETIEQYTKLPRLSNAYIFNQFGDTLATVINGVTHVIQPLYHSSQFLVLCEHTDSKVSNIDWLLTTSRSGDSLNVIGLHSLMSSRIYTNSTGNTPIALTETTAQLPLALEAQPFDSVIFFWKNPNNALDSILVSIPFLPDPQNAIIITRADTLAIDSGGIITTDTDSLSITIIDQMTHPDSTYQLIVIATNASTGRLDTILIPLDKSVSGSTSQNDTLRSVITFDNTLLNEAIDALGISGGDTLTFIYIDPVYGDTTQTKIIVNWAHRAPMRAVMHDFDRNGFGDAISIQFSGPIHHLPALIPEISWNPVDSLALFSVTQENISYRDTDGSPDSTSLFIDLSAIQLSIAGTAIDSLNKAYITLPNDGYFNGSTIPLSDSVSPRLLSVFKIPTQADESNIFAGIKPEFDQFVFSFSEEIRTQPEDPISSWNEQFLIHYNCDDGAERPLVLRSAIQSDTSTQIWNTTVSQNIPLSNDCISVIEESEAITDSLGNLLALGNVIIDGGDRHIPAEVTIQNPIAGTPRATTGLWIPPGSDIPVPIPGNQSVLSIVTNKRYELTAHIYNNLGSHLKTLKNTFGYNNEFSHSSRKTAEGFVNYVPWDMKAEDGKYAGSGVYLWSISIVYPSGATDLFFLKSGIMRQK